MGFEEQKHLNMHNRLFGVIFFLFYVTSNEKGS